MSKGELYMKKSEKFLRKLICLVAIAYGIFMMFGGFNDFQLQAKQGLYSLLADDK